MSEQQSPAPASGRLGTSTAGLRSFGQQILEHAATIKNSGLGAVVGGSVLPGSGTERALALAADACRAALARVHTDYRFAGDESAADSARFEEHEHDTAAGFQSLGDRIEGA